MLPMLATRGTSVPSGPEWVHEVKWDGMRLLADVSAGAVRLTARSGRDATVRFPELGGLAALVHDALLDGEAVAFAGGRPSFAALAERMHVSSARKAVDLATRVPVTYLVFDVLRLDGEDLVRAPWDVRRERLAGLGLAGVHWQVPEVYEDGPALLEGVRTQGLEGIVSKRRRAPYQPGRRSPDWLKFPVRDTSSYVVGGWRPETGSSSRLGAVLVGTPSAGGLVFEGRVGSGLTGRIAAALRERLLPLEVAESPFAGAVPRADAVGTVWVRPEVVVDVAALGRGGQGRLRQPSFHRVRPDLTPESLVQRLVEGGEEP